MRRRRIVVRILMICIACTYIVHISLYAIFNSSAFVESKVAFFHELLRQRSSLIITI